jgi:hypothetical protein
MNPPPRLLQPGPLQVHDYSRRYLVSGAVASHVRGDVVGERTKNYAIC